MASNLSLTLDKSGAAWYCRIGSRKTPAGSRKTLQTRQVVRRCKQSLDAACSRKTLQAATIWKEEQVRNGHNLVYVRFGPRVVADYDDRGLAGEPYERIVRPGVYELTQAEAREVLEDARYQGFWTTEPFPARKAYQRLARRIATELGVVISESGTLPRWYEL